MSMRLLRYRKIPNISKLAPGTQNVSFMSSTKLHNICSLMFFVLHIMLIMILPRKKKLSEGKDRRRKNAKEGNRQKVFESLNLFLLSSSFLPEMRERSSLSGLLCQLLEQFCFSVNSDLKLLPSLLDDRSSLVCT